MNTNIISYLLGKKAGGGTTINNQDKTVTQNGSYTADSGYTGLGTVTVNVPEPSGTISITQNGDNIDVKDYAKANVNVPEPTGNINITDTNLTNVKDYATAQVVDEDLVAGNIKKDVNILGIVGTYEGSGGDQLDLTTGVRFGNSLFSTLPTAIQNANWNDVTNFSNMFLQCIKLTTIPLLDTSSGDDFSQMFRNCSELSSVSKLNTSNGTSFSQMFMLCSSPYLTSMPQFNTSNGTNFSQMFGSCTYLGTIPELDLSKANNVSFFVNYCSHLTTLGGFKNLGQAYLTTVSANYTNYKLDLSTSTNLTHDSLMNVINDLYDIATAGVQAQQLLLGATNLAKLTASEIQIATDKGWSVS
ncbi:MAG: BspA family leucine-rich repeat surface protein [Bacilli bacterium]|nr:BspA family leucine-rich repeat surface protein [Bacilli bacterium]